MNIYDDVADQLIMYRHETRAAPLLDLVTILLDNGYEPALTEIYHQPLPDPNDETIRYEEIIVRCTVAFASKCGVAYNPQQVFRKPKEAGLILHGLLEGFEDNEDTDTLYGIVLSGEPPIFVLENLIRYVFGDDNLHVEDLIINVEKRVMTVLQNFLAAITLEKANLQTDTRVPLLAAYLRYFPQNPVAWAFLNLPAQVDEKTLIQQFDFDEDNGVNQTELLVIYAVGLCVAQYSDFDGAYTHLEKALEALNADGLSVSPILQEGLQALKTIYGEKVEDEQA
ncbi:hypothetical protein pEaSNUABM11_00054 [Erwinia phage pEa_SNUABM_11]|nr:hypothetical protein pEaSNUABM11_00054 [Erwinia phage pEa_SNUABM_11]